MRTMNYSKLLMKLNETYSKLGNFGIGLVNYNNDKELTTGYVEFDETLKTYPTIISVNVHEIIDILSSKPTKLNSDNIVLCLWKNSTDNTISFNIGNYVEEKSSISFGYDCNNSQLIFSDETK